MYSLSPDTQRKDLESLEVIALFTHLLFGLDLPYDATQINHLVEDLASARTYPKTQLKSDFVKQLLSVVESQKCHPTRMSFSEYDKLLTNALTFVMEHCQLPIDGIYFDDTYQPENRCCQIVNRAISEERQLQTCVPSEYIIFRPIQSLTYQRK
jgi:hypothetical protein